MSDGLGRDPAQGAGQFAGQPDIVLIAERNRPRRQIGMAEQMQEVCRTSQTRPVQQTHMAVRMGGRECAQQSARVIRRTVVARPEAPVRMALRQQAVQLPGQVGRTVPAGHHDRHARGHRRPPIARI